MKKYALLFLSLVLFVACDKGNSGANNKEVLINSRIYIDYLEGEKVVDLSLESYDFNPATTLTYKSDWVKDLRIEDNKIKFSHDRNLYSEKREVSVKVDNGVKVMDILIIQNGSGSGFIDFEISYIGYKSMFIESVDLGENSNRSYMLLCTPKHIIDKYGGLEGYIDYLQEDKDNYISLLDNGNVEPNPDFFGYGLGWNSLESDTDYILFAYYSNHFMQIQSEIFYTQFKTKTIPDSVPYDVSFEIDAISEDSIFIEFPSLKEVKDKMLSEEAAGIYDYALDVYTHGHIGISFWDIDLFKPGASKEDIAKEIMTMHDEYFVSKLGGTSLYNIAFNSALKGRAFSDYSFFPEFRPNSEFIISSFCVWEDKIYSNIDTKTFISPFQIAETRSSMETQLGAKVSKKDGALAPSKLMF